MTQQKFRLQGAPYMIWEKPNEALNKQLTRVNERMELIRKEVCYYKFHRNRICEMEDKYPCVFCSTSFVDKQIIKEEFG